jgi:drug/metabolite transporter (DMT)-like permease
VPADRILTAMGLVSLSVFLFALSDVLSKHLMTLYPVLLILFLRYAISTLILLAAYLPQRGRALFRTVRTGAVILRGLCLVAASITMGPALQRMPVGETVAIIYLAPFGVILVAVFGMGERWSWASLVACLVGFVGVLAIIRPGAGLDPLGVMFALMNVIPSVGYQLLSRSLAATETSGALQLWTAMVGAVCFGLALPWTLPGFAPSLTDAGLILVFGAIATAGHFLLTAAYARAPASRLAPINYLHLFWAGLLGWLVFDHVPDGWTMAGMALVGGAGMGLAIWTQVSRRRA